MKENEFDNYSLSCYRRCPTYYRRRIQEMLVKPTERKTAAEFGVGIHALEIYYKGGMTEKAKEETLAAFMLHFAPFETEADDKRTVVKGLSILTSYFQRYAEEPFEVVATEVGLAFDIGEYIYKGRLDLVVKWLSPPGIYGFDHKTTSDLDSIVVKPNNQFTGYIAYLNEMFENVHGFMANLIGVYKTDKQKDKSSGKMIERDIFRRYPTTRSPWEVEEWKKGVLQTIHQIEECKECGVWPRYDACKMYRTPCAFLDLCNAGSEEVVQRMIQGGMYEVSPWEAYKEEGGIEE